MDAGSVILPLADRVFAAVGLALLLGALAIDRFFGEPRSALHPVVWIGNYLKLIGRFTTRWAALPAFAGGALAWLAGAAFVAICAALLQLVLLREAALWLAAPTPGGVLRLLPLFVLAAWLFKSMLSWRMLRDETAAVEAALAQSLPAGRERLSWLVSRDTTQLSQAQVRESAIESLAENLNDSVIAPLFWFLLFGLPGAAVYRFANTADAMWGYRGSYRGQHWEWAGKWAAHADDLLSWWPARLTALFIALVSRPALLTRLVPEARKTPSPNSGWPMAAMALALDVQLGKPGVYRLNPEGREPVAGDMLPAQRHAGRALLLGATLAALVLAGAAP